MNANPELRQVDAVGLPAKTPEHVAGDNDVLERSDSVQSETASKADVIVSTTSSVREDKKESLANSIYLVLKGGTVPANWTHEQAVDLLCRRHMGIAAGIVRGLLHEHAYATLRAQEPLIAGRLIHSIAGRYDPSKNGMFEAFLEERMPVEFHSYILATSQLSVQTDSNVAASSRPDDIQNIRPFVLLVYQANKTWFDRIVSGNFYSSPSSAPQVVLKNAGLHVIREALAYCNFRDSTFSPCSFFAEIQGGVRQAIARKNRPWRESGLKVKRDDQRGEKIVWPYSQSVEACAFGDLKKHIAHVNDNSGKDPLSNPMALSEFARTIGIEVDNDIQRVVLVSAHYYEYADTMIREFVPASCNSKSLLKQFSDTVHDVIVKYVWGFDTKPSNFLHGLKTTITSTIERKLKSIPNEKLRA